MRNIEKIILEPIGIIHTENKKPQGTPIQPLFGKKGSLGRAEVFSEYVDGLADFEGFSHMILIYAFHLSKEYRMTVTPFLDDNPRSLFATRAPRRPNPIGLSVVELVKVVDGSLSFRTPDMVDGTPLLDIKPYVPDFDSIQARRIGWLTGKIGSRAGGRWESRGDSCQGRSSPFSQTCAEGASKPCAGSRREHDGVAPSSRPDASQIEMTHSRVFR
jgi:tRNA-Thr(GGU) m(6)t(6)A37 methyltransferase TsaA